MHEGRSTPNVVSPLRSRKLSGVVSRPSFDFHVGSQFEVPGWAPGLSLREYVYSTEYDLAEMESVLRVDHAWYPKVAADGCMKKSGVATLARRPGVSLHAVKRIFQQTAGGYLPLLQTPFKLTPPSQPVGNSRKYKIWFAAEKVCS